LTGSDYRNYQDFQNEEGVLEALEAAYGNNTKGAGRGSARMIWKFMDEVKPGHIVVANDGFNKVVGIGVIESGYLSPKSAKNPIRKDKTTHRHHVRRVKWRITDVVVVPGKQVFTQPTLECLNAKRIDRIRRAYEASYPHLNATLNTLFDGPQPPLGFIPEEVSDTISLVEGAVRQITVNAYERNPVARQQCIDSHGTACCICGFSFGTFYGPETDGYIHVHHLRPLSEIGIEYVVDPVKDLRPVCPNCHAVLHLGSECRTIEEVEQLIAKQRQAEPGTAPDPAT
jgi:hypothetical protein